MSRRLAILTLTIQVLSHSLTMAQRHDPGVLWLMVHLYAGIGSIIVLAYPGRQPLK